MHRIFVLCSCRLFRYLRNIELVYIVRHHFETVQFPRYGAVIVCSPFLSLVPHKLTPVATNSYDKKSIKVTPGICPIVYTSSTPELDTGRHSRSSLLVLVPEIVFIIIELNT